MRENSRSEYNSFSLLRFVFSKWKIFLIVLVASAVLSFICASLIRPHFRATAVIFGPRTNAISKVLLADETNNERLDIKAYAIEEETEQMMEVLGSRDIKDAIIKKYNMLEHYDLDTTKKYWKTKLYKYMTESLTIKRTKYGAISITFDDYDPVLACNVTNDVLDLLDSVKRRMENERAAAAYAVLEKQLADVDAEIDRIDDSLKMYMEHGVFEFEGQSERVMQQYAIAVAQGNTAAVQRLGAELEKLATWGPRAHALYEVQFNFRKYQSLVKQKMMDTKVDMENEIPTKFVVERAIVPDKKAYPKRIIVILAGTFGTLVMCILLLLLLDFVRPEEVEIEK